MDKRRILFYSHDTLGLGHLRRTLKLAHTLLDEPGPARAGASAEPEATCLVVTGSACPQLLEARPGLDFVKLPSVRKRATDDYPARTLDLSQAQIVELRARIIRASVEGFRPHALVVDNVARGMLGELEPSLLSLKRAGAATRIILTLRDILDQPAAVRQHWRAHGVYRLLEELYDEILVFGCREAFDATHEYALPESVARRTTYCGYIGSPAALAAAPPVKLLFTTGGGVDGGPLARSFLEACARVPEEIRSPTLMVLGPEMPEPERIGIEAAALEVAGVSAVAFLPDLVAHLASASAVVCMGGYNTLCETVSLGRRALVIPRCAPRLEQAMRARLFERRGLVRTLSPADATPERLAQELRRLAFAPAPPDARRLLGFDGLESATRRILGHAADAEQGALARVAQHVH